ncbi:unnamed protein product [Schistosoma curassoni]|uniref:Uncharacterized protein n=1 Tax=Schistosoma curassoni TaxID=6186 RepID=A0A183K7N9_9TREM|nr:unnamed protein product [Schistosoma curassoni]
MIHIAEAEIGVLDSTGWARRKAGPIKTLDCSYGFYVSSVRSVIHSSPNGSIFTLFINREHGPHF